MNKLSYYQKMGDIASQLETIIEKSKKNEVVQTIGIPDSYTPQDLINFHGERLRILEVAVKCKEDKIREWIECAKQRLTGNPETDFEVLSEIDLLESGLT